MKERTGGVRCRDELGAEAYGQRDFGLLGEKGEAHEYQAQIVSLSNTRVFLEGCNVSENDSKFIGFSFWRDNVILASIHYRFVK